MEVFTNDLYFSNSIENVIRKAEILVEKGLYEQAQVVIGSINTEQIWSTRQKVTFLIVSADARFGNNLEGKIDFLTDQYKHNNNVDILKKIIFSYLAVGDMDNVVFYAKKVLLLFPIDKRILTVLYRHGSGDALNAAIECAIDALEEDPDLQFLQKHSTVRHIFKYCNREQVKRLNGVERKMVNTKTLKLLQEVDVYRQKGSLKKMLQCVREAHKLSPYNLHVIRHAVSLQQVVLQGNQSTLNHALSCFIGEIIAKFCTYQRNSATGCLRGLASLHDLLCELGGTERQKETVRKELLKQM